uniref:Uncharacterized protein n=1 Tax=Arundo donax TaxID=35708 RepID=A0A0A9DNP4_ARUDO
MCAVLLKYQGKTLNSWKSAYCRMNLMQQPPVYYHCHCYHVALDPWFQCRYHHHLTVRLSSR